MASFDDLPTLMRDREVADWLGCSVRSVWRKSASQELPRPHHIGRLARWNRDEIIRRLKLDRER